MLSLHLVKGSEQIPGADDALDNVYAHLSTSGALQCIVAVHLHNNPFRGIIYPATSFYPLSISLLPSIHFREQLTHMLNADH